ncbi:MAG: CCA tRNA nucleotidyltransferase [Candidatus Omnitrophica bacterium]|nr:CCA tRNA nucleotidyltransferase [Candidatus Omnitrophota bacterium]
MKAYAVGGCVRDWMLGITQTPDLDVAVEGDSLALARAIAAELGGDVTAVHEQFRTATITLEPSALSLERHLDIAMCRKETYARPAAYPTVAPGALKDDLRRRDFTINAMAVALAPAQFGRLIDPFHGARDLRRRQLRILHPRSFLDDPSRILRGIRFAHRFHLRWEASTARALRRAVQAGAIGWLNAGRLRKELDLMTREGERP